MALNINFNTKFGDGGNYVNFDPQIANKTEVSLRMNFWKDKATRNMAGMLPFNDKMAGNTDQRITDFKCNYKFDLDLSSPLNLFQQAYAYLKTLPEFADATDDVTEDQSAELDIIQTTAVNLKTQLSNKRVVL